MVSNKYYKLAIVLYRRKRYLNARNFASYLLYWTGPIELPRDKLPMEPSPDSASYYTPESSSSPAGRISDPSETSSSPNGFHQDVEIEVDTATSLSFLN